MVELNPASVGHMPAALPPEQAPCERKNPDRGSVTILIAPIAIIN